MFAMLPLALQIGGALTGAVGSYYQAQSRQFDLRYRAGIADAEASIADSNARIAEIGAQSELARGQREEQASRLKTAHLKSSQRASMAANGIDLGQGSAAEILTTTDYMGEVDATTIKDNAIRSAWGYRAQGVNQQNEALMKRASAGSLRTMANAVSPTSAAFSSLLGSAGQVATTWYSLKKEGAFGSDVKKANESDDPIYELGKQRGWWSK